MKYDKNILKKLSRILSILLLCLTLLAGCAKTVGGNAGGGKNEEGSAGSGAEDAPFEEKTLEEINGKDEKNDKTGQEDADGIADIVSSVKDSIFTGPEGTIPPEALQPDNDFAGLYVNDAYTALIVKGENGEMQVTIASASADPAVSEWTMSGFFSDENYRIRYGNAVKALVTYGADGAIASREIEYEQSSGMIQFSDPDHFLWTCDTEPIEKNVFQRVRPTD